MTSTIGILLGGLAIFLMGLGLLGTLLGVRGGLAGFSSTEIGLVMGGYYLGYILGTLLGPTLVRRVGHIRAFVFFAALATAAALACGLWVYPWAWLPLRVLNGSAVVGVYMVVESWLNSQTENRDRGRVFGIYMMTTLLALALGQFLTLAADPVALDLFVVAALLLVISVLPIAATRLREPLLETGTAFGLRRLLTISPLGTAGALGSGLLTGVFWGMTPAFAHALAMPSVDIAWLMFLTILGGVLLQWPVGLLSDRMDRRVVLVTVIGLTALAASVVTAIVMGGTHGLLTMGFVYGGLMFPIYSLAVSHTNDHLQAGEVLGATRGLLMVYGVGAIAGPFLAGTAMDLFGPPAVPGLAAFSAFALLLYGLYRMTRRRPPATGQQGANVPLVRTTPVVLEMYPGSESADTKPEATPRI